MRKLITAFILILVGPASGAGQAPGVAGGTAKVTELGSFGGTFLSASASPDGRHIAVVVEDGGKRILLLDGKMAAESGSAPVVIFSPDSKRVAFTADTVPAASGISQAYLSLDGRTIPNGRRLIFSPDSSRTLYTVLKFAVGEVAVIDGRESPVYAGITSSTFSPDSRHVAIVASKGQQRWTVFTDGQSVSAPWGTADYLTFSPDTKHLAYVATADHGGKAAFCLVQDGKANAFYDYMDKPLYSPDSKHLACFAATGKKTFVVFDGKEIDVTEERLPNAAPGQWFLAFSPDSKSLAYCKAGQTILQTNGVEKTYGDKYYMFCDFSPDSKKFAYCVRKDAKFEIIINGTVGKAYDVINTESLTFSPDSKHVAFVAENQQDSLVVVDGEDGAGYEKILPMGAKYCTFTADGAVEYLAMKGNKLYRVHVPVPKE